MFSLKNLILWPELNEINKQVLKDGESLDTNIRPVYAVKPPVTSTRLHLDYRISETSPFSTLSVTSVM